jgi:hypothetical protein
MVLPDAVEASQSVLLGQRTGTFDDFDGAFALWLSPQNS